MRTVLTTNITATAEMPVTKAVLDQFQLAPKELINSLAETVIGKQFGTIGQFALNGVVNSGSGLNYDISHGWILYNGTIYEVDAVVFTAGGGQTAVASIITTYDATDPLQYTDGSFHNTIQTKKITFSGGASGSGIFDYSALNFVSMEAARTVGAAGEPAFGALWDAGTGNGLRFRRDAQKGLVTIEGLAFANGTPGLTDAIFTLPAGYRPLQDVNLPCLYYDQTTLWPAYVVISSTTGKVTMVNTQAIPLVDNDNLFINVSFYNH